MAVGRRNRLTGITLIGMPGCGKSTVGVLLAKRLAIPFIDTDIELQGQIGMTLQAYIAERSFLDLRRAEEDCILGLVELDGVIATGGSVVYGASAMQKLAAHTDIVFLDIDFATMQKRLGDFRKRGIAADTAAGLESVYQERLPLYQQYAHMTVAASADIEYVIEAIARELAAKT